MVVSPNGGRAERKPLRRRRRWLFVGVALLMVALVVELGGVLTWWGMTGEWFTWGRAETARAMVGGEISTAERDVEEEQQAIQQVVNQGNALHPYLGYVSNAELANGAGLHISDYGFVDSDPPLHRRGDDGCIVGLVGGSVALQLALYGEDRLVAELQKSPSLRGKRIKVVCMALGGWKQPQQVFAMQLAWLRGGEFDILINLDGFNEVASVTEIINKGVPAWFPRNWARLLDAVPTPDQQRRIGHLVVLREQRAQMSASATSVWWSPTLQSLWLWRDRRLAARIGEVAAKVEHAASAPSYAVTGPGTEGLDASQWRVEMVELWRRASLQLHALCELHGTHYFHFLQPNQYVPGSKPIGPEEAMIALTVSDHPYVVSVEHGYPLLRRAGEQLRQQGVAFTDLTQIFRDHREPLYVDKCCHFGRRGNEILAVRIAARVREQIDLDGFAVQRLSLRPEQLRLTSPLRSARLEVLAVDQAGREVDVSGLGLGTQISVDPAGAVVVAADGSLRATRRGSSRVQARFRGLVATLELIAEWPDEFVEHDGWSAGDGQTGPTLRVVEGENGALLVGCADLPSSGFRLLAASREPLPATIRPGQESFGVATALLPGDRDQLTAGSPMAAQPGQPLFLRVYVVAVDTAALLAVSNTLVVTRD